MHFVEQSALLMVVEECSYKDPYSTFGEYGYLNLQEKVRTLRNHDSERMQSTPTFGGSEF